MQFLSTKSDEVRTDCSPSLSRATAVIVPCSSRKSARPNVYATAVSLSRASQGDVETTWTERLKSLPQSCEAGSLYAGRGVQLGRKAAALTGGTLFIASAGLGLVAADQMVPTYGLTVSGRGPESVAQRVLDHFDIESWWRTVSMSPFSTAFSSILARDMQLPVLLALTQPYARLLARALDQLTTPELERLRISGTGLTDLLPERVSRQILPYDSRLESVLPGTKADFPHRALLHFAENGLEAHPAGDISEHREWVEVALAGRAVPSRPTRPRVTDDEIVQLIERYLPETHAIGRLLRLLRDREGVACEQRRFTRLYRTARKRRLA